MFTAPYGLSPYVKKGLVFKEEFFFFDVELNEY
jgi:hypothetical protein